MRLFNDVMIKFQRPDWSVNPELGLIDTVLEQHPELFKLLESDITKGITRSDFGRKDTPSVEQIVRAAIYKEFKSLTYRDLEYAQLDSRICVTFIKLDERKPFSFQVWQKYISKISKDSLKAFLVTLNQIAIEEGLEDLQVIRIDSTVIESNIHHPTNSSLVWDCIKEAHRLLSQLSEYEDIKVRDHRKGAKSNHFKINNSSGDKRVGLFKKRLNIFTRSINQVNKFAKKKTIAQLNVLVWLAHCRNYPP